MTYLMKPNPDPFEFISFSEKQLLYRGLLSLVTSNSGYGFHNNDQGQPAYAIGRDGTQDYQKWGDSAEHNCLFKMMHTLSVELNEAAIDGTAELADYVFSWSNFCELAYTAYLRAQADPSEAA